MDDVENRYASKEFEPYALALGQVALAWNDLQDSLSGVFSLLMNPPPRPGSIADDSAVLAWASLKSDRAQKEMLKAVSQRPPLAWEAIYQNVGKEVEWLVDRALDLEVSRNDAVHSPLFQATGILSLALGKPEKILPNPYSFNRRAMSLAKRGDILQEFYYCRDSAIVLGNYAIEIQATLINHAVRPWPARPKLPIRPNRISRPHE